MWSDLDIGPLVPDSGVKYQVLGGIGEDAVPSLACWW
jgi:hypothetical protein